MRQLLILVLCMGSLIGTAQVVEISRLKIQEIVKGNTDGKVLIQDSSGIVAEVDILDLLWYAAETGSSANGSATRSPGPNPPGLCNWFQMFIDSSSCVNFPNDTIVISSVDTIYLVPPPPPIAPCEQGLTLTYCVGDSIQYGGDWYSSPEVFYDTLYSNHINTCDTIIHVVITQGDWNYNLVTLSFCTGDSILHEGVWYSAPYSSIDTVESGSEECDAINTLNIYEIPNCNEDADSLYGICCSLPSITVVPLPGTIPYNGRCHAQGITIDTTGCPIGGTLSGRIDPALCEEDFLDQLKFTGIAGQYYDWDRLGTPENDDYPNESQIAFNNGPLVPADIWRVTVTNDLGCVTIQEIDLRKPVPLDFEFNIINTSCATCTDGGACLVKVLNTYGGQLYNVDWDWDDLSTPENDDMSNNGIPDEDLFFVGGLGPGNYSLTMNGTSGALCNSDCSIVADTIIIQ